MKAIVQRVTSAKVDVDGKTVGEIGQGLLVLVAAHRDDTEHCAQKLAERIANLRIFNDHEGRMNLSISMHAENRSAIVEQQVSDRAAPASILAVSNFTVLGDTTQRRPSFIAAAPYEQGERLFNAFVDALKAIGIDTQTGVFGADMKVTLTNDGPVTVIVVS